MWKIFKNQLKTYEQNYVFWGQTLAINSGHLNVFCLISAEIHMQ